MEPIHAKGIVLIFAKIPGLGIAKSRIAATAGKEAAAEVYSELLTQTAATVSPFKHTVAFAGSHEPGPLSWFFPDAIEFMPQISGTLGERLKSSFAQQFDIGYTTVVCVGCDCPEMTKNDIHDALHVLKAGTDVVLGPAADGGYYLVGANKKGSAVLNARGWSTQHLLDETLRIADADQLSVHLLPERSDIDTWNDYQNWKKRIPS